MGRSRQARADGRLETASCQRSTFVSSGGTRIFETRPQSMPPPLTALGFRGTGQLLIWRNVPFAGAVSLGGGKRLRPAPP